LIGSGIVDESCGFNITGTSEHIGILCGHDNHNAYDLRLGRYPHVVDGYDVLYGATSAGGGSIQWFCNKFLPEIDKNLFENEIEMRMRKIPDLQGILFLPYLNGERAPIWNSDARGVFFGLEATHGIDQMLQAVFEGVALSLYDCWAVIGEHVQMPEMLRVAGAASTNGLWNQMKADVFGIPVTTMQCKESTCLGAAIIAAVGAGWYPDLTNAISQMTHIGSSYVPEERSTNRYRKMFSMYRKLYGLLKPLFSDLASFRSQT
jgi:xylulokinase